MQERNITLYRIAMTRFINMKTEQFPLDLY